MKRIGLSRGKLALFFVAAAAMLLGVLLIFKTMEDGEYSVAWEAFRGYLMAEWSHIVWRLVLAGGLLVGGFGIILFLLLNFSRRSFRIQREAEALRQKKEEAEALNRQNQQLAHHQRLHIIGTLTSSIAHEFNNLLTPIMGYSMMALEQIPPEKEELYDDILEIYNASCKAKTIISRLSDLSRRNTSTTFRRTSPDDLVRKMLDVAAPAKPPRVETRMSLNCWEQRMEANEIQIGQLLLNLFLNSFDAIGREEGLLEVATSFDEKYIYIVVRDSGYGISEETLPHIFEPFFTTKEAGKGTGLGLAIVAQVVEDHHGKVSVKSRVGEGTVFTVSLPRTRKEKENTAEM